MTDDAEEPLLVLMPVPLFPDAEGHVPGTTKTPCSQCGVECWIAPSGRATLYPRWCIPCALAESEGDEVQEHGIHGAALVELADSMNLDPFVLAEDMRKLGWEIWD